MARKSNVNSRVQRAHALARERSKDIKLPYKVGRTLHLLKLGNLKKKKYHTAKALYPIGFKTKRSYYCCIDPRKRVDYINEIIDGGEYPLFKVTHPSGLVFTTNSPYTVWKKTLDKINAACDALKLPGNYKTKTVAGSIQFGLSHKTIMGLLEGLDGALDCKEYTWPEQPAGHFFKLDDLVLARWDKDNEFYPAIVTSRLRNGTYNVRFYDGVEAKQLGEADLKPRSTLSGEMDMPFSFLGSAQRSGNKRRIIRTEKKQMYDQQQVAKSGTRRQQKTSRKVSSARKGGKAAKVSKTSGGKKRKRQVKEEPAEVQPKKRRGGRQQNATKTQRRSTGRKGVKEESESETEEEDDTESVDEESSEEEEEVPKSGRRQEKTPVRKPPVVTKRQTTVSAGMSLLARISSSLRGRSNPPKRQPSPKVAARGGSPRASPKRTKRDMLTKSVAAVLGQVLVSVAANIDLGMKECRVYLDSAIMYGKIDDTVNSSAVYADVLKKLKKLYDKWSIELITDQGAIHRGDVGVYLDIRVV